VPESRKGGNLKKFSPLRLCILLVAILGSSDCARRQTNFNSTAVDEGVRTFIAAVAHDVTQDGPTAWSRHFANTPAFFMAVNGQMAFPSGAAAQAAIPSVAQSIRHIELQWGGDLRVDVLTPTLAVVAAPYREIQADASGHRVEDKGYFTGVVEFQNEQWQFRDAHWSSAGPPVPVP
jgi:hypothetical protein